MDIDRSGQNEMILQNSDLKQKWLQIQLNEKQILLQQIDTRLAQLKTVEIKQMELKRDIVLREIDTLKSEVGAITIDAETVPNS